MDLKKYKFTDDHGHPLENCVDYISMQKEIIALRSECKRLIHEAAYMQQDRDEHKLRRGYAETASNKWQQEIETLRSELKDVVQALNDEERRGDEWKRRADEMHYWMQTGTCNHKYHENFWAEFVHNCEEAAEWFEEKDDE